MHFNLRASRKSLYAMTCDMVSFNTMLDTQFVTRENDDRLIRPYTNADVHKALTETVQRIISNTYTTPMVYDNLVVFITERVNVKDYNLVDVDAELVRGYEVCVQSVSGQQIVCKQLLVFDDDVAVFDSFSVLAVNPRRVASLDARCGGDFLPLADDGGLKPGVYRHMDEDNFDVMTRVYRHGKLYVAVTVTHKDFKWSMHVAVGVDSFCMRLHDVYRDCDVMTLGKHRALVRDVRRTLLACNRRLPVTRPWACKRLVSAFTAEFVHDFLEPVTTVGNAKAYIAALNQTFMQFAAADHGDGQAGLYARIRATELVRHVTREDLLRRGCTEVKLPTGVVVHDGKSVKNFDAVCVPFVLTKYGLVNAKEELDNGIIYHNSPSKHELRLREAGDKLIADAEKYESACAVLTHG